MQNPSISDVQNFWDARPCNIRHSNLPFGSREYFNAVTAKKFFVEPHIPSFADFSAYKGKKVLEIGCGIGTCAEQFVDNGALYTGVDLSKQSVEITNSRLSQIAEPDSFTVINANAEELSSYLEPSPYDLIFSFGVIHHTPSPKKIINQILQYSTSQTKIKIMLYAKTSWKNIMIQHNLDQPEAQYGCPIAHTYTSSDVKELLDPLTVISIRQTHIFPYKIDEYKQGIFQKQPWFEHMPQQMFSALEESLGWHLLIDASLSNMPSPL